MVIVWSKVLPVIISIGIILTVAVLREYSRELAAIFTTMPINMPLAMWLVYGTGENQADFALFTRRLFINMIPTITFIIVAWLVTRMGWKLIPSILAGYASWGVMMWVLWGVLAL